jgi:hypothetical protein
LRSAQASSLRLSNNRIRAQTAFKAFKMTTVPGTLNVPGIFVRSFARRFGVWSGGRASVRGVNVQGPEVPRVCGPMGAHGFYRQMAGGCRHQRLHPFAVKTVARMCPLALSSPQQSAYRERQLGV